MDILSQSVERLGQLSMGISDELGHQNKLLDSMETDLEAAGDDLDLVTRKTRDFIQQAGGTNNCMLIASLTLVAIILLFLILYT